MSICYWRLTESWSLWSRTCSYKVTRLLSKTCLYIVKNTEKQRHVTNGPLSTLFLIRRIGVNFRGSVVGCRRRHRHLHQRNFQEIHRHCKLVRFEVGSSFYDSCRRNDLVKDFWGTWNHQNRQ